MQNHNNQFSPFILQGSTPMSLGLNDSVSSLFQDLLGNIMDPTLNNSSPAFQNHNINMTPQQQQQLQQQQQQVDSPEMDDFNFDAPDEGLVNPNLHSIACLQCRKLHRKCDKKYPSCSECLERGKECSYRTPKKKGRTKGSKNKPKPAPPLPQEKVKKTLVVINHTSSSSSSSSSDSENLSPPSQQNSVPQEGSTQQRTTSLATARKVAHPYALSNQQLFNDILKRSTIDMYFDIVGMGCCVIPKPKMERLAYEYLNDDDPTGEDHFYDSSSYRLSSTKCSVRALLYSMQALCEQRRGFSESSIAAYREAKKNLALSFDDLDNPYIKLTYGILSSFLAGEGDDITSHFYLNSLKYALDKPSDKSSKKETASDLSVEDDEKLLRAFMMKCSLCSKYDNVDNLNIWDSFNTLYSIKTQKQPPYSLDNILKNGITPTDVPKLMSLIELIKTILENYAVHSRFSPLQATLSALMKEIICISSKITILLSVGVYEGELLETLADQITLITEHDLFGMLPCSLTHFTIVPITVHIKIFPKVEKMIGDRLDSGRSLLSILEEPYVKRYFDNIAKDLRAMQMLKLRYKRIDKYYSRVTADLEKINKWKLEKQFDLIESFEFGTSPVPPKKNEHFPFKSAFQSSFIGTHPFDPSLRNGTTTTPEQEKQGMPTPTRQEKESEPVGSSPVDSSATFRANHQPIQPSDLFDVSNDDLFPFEMDNIVNTDIFANIDEF